jgi:uncharacterized protein (TIGR02594 family)
MYNTVLLNTGLSQYGIKEIPGSEDNDEVVKYFESVGYGNLGDETAWCSAYMNWIAWRSGLEMSGKLTARSWLSVGDEILNPQPGDVVILWRESPDSWKGHVGLFIREDDEFIYILGGNQGNQVRISPYKKHRLLGYRRLRPAKKVIEAKILPIDGKQTIKN